jgi:hypothetical protein
MKAGGLALQNLINIFDIFVDSLIFMNFHYMKIHRLLSSQQRRNIFRQYLGFLTLTYPPELEAKETTHRASSTSFSDIYVEFDDSGQLGTKIYDKRDFNFKIINFPNMCSNIPVSPAYGVYISQLIRYARASSNYSDFLKRHLKCDANFAP